MAEDQGYGEPVPPHLINYASNEPMGNIPSSLRYRKFLDQNQPTIANSMGMHKLPPVGMRVPIADQYAMGIARPDVGNNNPDPTLYTTVNGNVSLGQSVEERRAAQLGMRKKLQQQARLKNVAEVGLINYGGTDGSS